MLANVFQLSDDAKIGEVNCHVDSKTTVMWIRKPIEELHLRIFPYSSLNEDPHAESSDMSGALSRPAKSDVSTCCRIILLLAGKVGVAKESQ